MKYNAEYDRWVSKEGIVYRYDNKQNKLVLCTESKTKTGYITIATKIGSKCLHRIVYETFVGPIPQGYHIDHINNIRNDNRLENLQALTALENERKAHKGRKFTEEHKRKLSEAQKGMKKPWTTEYNKTRVFKQSNESRKKISESMKKRWEEKRNARR